MKTKPCHCCGGTGAEMDHVAMGHKMRSLRQAKGFSLRRLGNRLRLSAAYLSDLENGKRNWRDELINAYEKL